MQNLLVILGPTALGKTQLAVNLAAKHAGEIISADSRQVYRGMDIGTGKDLAEYTLNGQAINYHLIDICEAGEHYNIFRYQSDFRAALEQMKASNTLPILCGGTGLYLQTALQEEKLVEVPINAQLREELSQLTQDQLVEYLLNLKPKQHNQTDLLDPKRTIRAIELAKFEKHQTNNQVNYPALNALIFGITAPREVIRERIESRLNTRLQEGMIEEVKSLMNDGLSLADLLYYGLEYKFIGQHLAGMLTYDEMHQNLLQGIRRFAKKQMTWYRRMEKQGQQIHWLAYDLPLEEKMEVIKKQMDEKF